MHTRTLLFVTVGLSLVAGCKVGSKQLEDNITNGLKDQYGVEMKSVSCPSSSSDSYTCTGVTLDGDKIDIDVTSDGSGGVKWQTKQAIVDMSKLGDGLESDIGSGADVTCPKKNVIAIKGKKFSCDVTIKGEKGKAEITCTGDNDKPFKIKLVEGKGGDDDGDDDKGKGKKAKGDDDDDDKGKADKKKSKGDDDDDDN